MQEIQALDHEVKRLKEVRAIHKEYRRYAEMPSEYLIWKYNPYSWTYVSPLRLLSRME